jgi:metal-responsive CopG/Arc/MetJ family transcriptional regulator
MPDTSERVTVRIPQELVDGLKKIQENLGHTTISDTIRAALEEYIQVQLPNNRARKTVVSLPHHDYLQLKELADEGVNVDMEDAIRTAVREYVRSKLEHLARTSGGGSHKSGSAVGDGLLTEGG